MSDDHKPHGSRALDVLVAVLDSLPCTVDTSYEGWWCVGLLIHKFDSSDNGLTIWDNWSKAGNDPRYRASDLPARWAAFGADKEVDKPTDQGRISAEAASEMTHEIWAAMPSVLTALPLVLAERRQQIHRHGRTPALDLYYNRDDQLSLGAVAYILPPGHGYQRPHYWPWAGTSYRPSKHDPSDPLAVLHNRKADLIKGIAMALADLERVITVLNQKSKPEPTAYVPE